MGLGANFSTFYKQGFMINYACDLPPIFIGLRSCPAAKFTDRQQNVSGSVESNVNITWLLNVLLTDLYTISSIPLFLHRFT